jgi:hypothetical protein
VQDALLWMTKRRAEKARKDGASELVRSPCRCGERRVAVRVERQLEVEAVRASWVGQSPSAALSDGSVRSPIPHPVAR